MTESENKKKWKHVEAWKDICHKLLQFGFDYSVLSKDENEKLCGDISMGYKFFVKV